MSKPLVSIIVPVYNAADYLAQCLNSLLNQSYKLLEILICDDCSKDESWQVLQRFQDDRLKCIRNDQNQGVVFTRNRLLEIAKGDYITFQDADDYSHPDRIKHQVDFLQEHAKSGACGTQFIKVNNSGEELFKSTIPTDYQTIRNSLPRAFHFCCASVMIRRQIYDEIGGYHMYFDRVNDEDLYWIASFVVKYEFVNLDQPLYYYRYNPQSLTKNVINIDPKRKFVHHITQYLVQQLIDSGSNDLLEKNFDQLGQLEKKLEQRYLEDPSLIYREFTDHYLHWDDAANAVKSALLGLMKTPSLLNFKYFIITLFRKYLK